MCHAQGAFPGTSKAPVLFRDQRVTAHPSGVTKHTYNGGQSVEKPPGVGGECSTQGLAAEQDHAHPQARRGRGARLLDAEDPDRGC